MTAPPGIESWGAALRYPLAPSLPHCHSLPPSFHHANPVVKFPCAEHLVGKIPAQAIPAKSGFVNGTPIQN